MELTHLQCDHQTEPKGLTASPCFSWKLISGKTGTNQAAYRLRILADGRLVYDSGRVDSSRSIEVRASDFFPVPQTQYTWEVHAWDNHGDTAQAQSTFESGIGQWRAKWIEAALTHASYQTTRDDYLMPVTVLRREFTPKQTVVRARVYATAHGAYQLQFNGQTPDTRRLPPEYTAYQGLLCYQIYDITALLRAGANTCTVMLADGWWAGRIGMSGECGQHGMTRALLLQIELTYADGSRETIVSDESFRCTQDGMIRYADIFIGEKQDAGYRKRLGDYTQAGYDDSGWGGVTVREYGYDTLQPQLGDGVYPFAKIAPKEILYTSKGETVVDFGQNFAGYVRLRLHETAGTEVKLEHSETLDANGNYLNNILGNNKDQTDVYICGGEAEELFEPVFTFHGFRYVRVSGVRNLKPEDMEGVAISSRMEKLIDFSCSNGMLNQLHSNALWSQYANMLSIPTDCPQRERAGWCGDIQVYAPTAAFHQDVDAFLSRWMKSVKIEQFADGQIPNVVPYSPSYRALMNRVFRSDCSTGWAEACIVVPYTLYKVYGNQEILKEYYPVMKRWMQYAQSRAENGSPEQFERQAHKTPRQIENNRYLWNTDWHFGDWMIPSISSKGPRGGVDGARITKELIASIYYGYSAGLMAQIAQILGNSADAAYYTALNERIRTAVSETYIAEDGSITPELQGCYVCALWYGMVPEEKTPQVVAHLKKLIEKNGGCLDTGFLATPVLLDVLMKYGEKDLAYRILYQENCPSWFYEIKKGATTIWESWTGIKPDGEVGQLSYNHYAFGSVCDWIYRTIGGIRCEEPGYRRFTIRPDPDDTLRWAVCRYESVYGTIVSDWRREAGQFTLRAEIPCNTAAQVVMPDGSRYEVGAGSYTFVCRDAAEDS